MTKPNPDARTHQRFAEKPTAFVVRYDNALLAQIKRIAHHNNESINKTINDLCRQAISQRCDK